MNSTLGSVVPLAMFWIFLLQFHDSLLHTSPFLWSPPLCIFAAPPKIGGWDPKVVITLGQDLSLRSSRMLVDPRNIDRMQQKYKTHINDDSDEKRLGVR